MSPPLNFAASIASWARAVDGAIEAIFQEAVQELVEQMQGGAPVDTGFLRASLMASNQAMPELNRLKGTAVPSDGQIVAVIQGTELGDTIYLGYTANYAGFVHFGAEGRSPRPWVLLAAQRWPQIVEAKTSELRGRLGL